MSDFEAWLNRKPKGPAPRKPLARYVRPKPVSARRRKESPKYKAATDAHLAEFPRCQIGPVIAAAGLPIRCLGVGSHVHHTRGRGRYLCDRSTFLTSCSGECHPEWIHFTNRDEAEKLGLIFPRRNSQ